jgi:HEAT repeat protein
MRNFEMKSRLLPLALSASFAVACNETGGDEAIARSIEAAAEEAPAGHQDLVAADEAEVVPEDWEAWVAAEVTRLRSSDPELYNALRSLEPRMTRARALRFTAPDLLPRPEAAPILIDRFINGNEPDAVRAALVEAIGMTGAPFGPAMVGLLERERDAYVRETMVATLKFADRASAHRGLRLGISDTDPGVRTAAIYALGRRDDGAALGDALLVAATDPEGGVQQAAVQTLGAFGIEEAKDTLVGLLSDESPELRYLSLRAIERIDAPYAASLPRARAMRDDPDPRVSKLATQLTTP